MASGGLPHQPLPAAFLAHFGKDSHGHANAGLLDSRGPSASALPPQEIHPRHIIPDERDAFISWLRGEFAAANAIIDAMCHHLRMIGEPSEYDFLFTCIQQRRYNWTLVLHMQQFFSVAEVIYALQQATWRKQQARNVNQQAPAMQHRSVEDLKDPRALNMLRGLKGEVPSMTPQSEISAPDMSAVMNRDVSLSDLSITQEVYNGKRLQSPIPKVNELEASQTLSKSSVDPIEQSTSQASPDSTHRTMPKYTEGQEPHIDAENKAPAAKSPGSYGGKLFSTDFTPLSKEEQDARLPMIKVSKHFQCWEHVEGKLVNVVEGLELFENVLNSYEASQVAYLITEMQAAGRRGELGGKTFVVEKRLSGSAKEMIQFGTENSKSSGELMQPMPLVFNSLIDRLILWHILPASKRPDYCSIEVLEEGEDCPPFLNYQHVDQYFCCLFLMAESTLVLGHNLNVDGGGEYKSRFKLPLPSGSALVIQGNSAEVASRAVVASPGKRIVVTFAKLVSSKAADVLPAGAKFAHPVPPNSLLTSAAAAASWPPVPLPGGVPPGVHGIVPAMMKQFGMANASGVLPIPPVRPFSHPPHHIPQHLVTAPGSLQGVIPAGPARTFPPMGVLSPGGWPAVPPRAPPPRPPNTGTGVFFPSSGSPGGNTGRPISASQMQAGVIMVSPLLPKTEPLVAYPPPTTETSTLSHQASRNQRPLPSSEVGDHTVDRGESYAPWHPSPGSGSSEPVVPRKGTRKESAHTSLNKAGANGNNTSNIKEEPQQRGGFHRPNKASGGKN